MPRTRSTSTSLAASRRGRSRRRHGLTATELLVAFVVLGMLAALATAGLSGVRQRAGTEATETALVAVVREAQALALSRADGTVTEQDFERALADVPSAAAVLAVSAAPRWTLVADPVIATDDPSRIDAPLPTADQMRIGFAPGRTAASVVVLLEDQVVLMAAVPASGSIALRQHDTSADPGLEPTAAAAMLHLIDRSATLAYGEADPTPTTATPLDTNPAPAPTGTAVDLTHDPQGTGGGVVEHLATLAGTSSTRIDPLGERLMLQAPALGAGQFSDLLDGDTATAAQLDGAGGTRLLVDLTQRATLSLTGVRLTMADPATVYADAQQTPISVGLAVSRDGGSFTAVPTSATVLADGSLLVETTTSEPGAHRHVRVSSAAPLEVAELELYGLLYEVEPLPVAAPSGLTAMVDEVTDEVTLSWDPVPGAAGYQVLRNGEFLASPSTPGVVDAPATDASHDYEVTATIPDRASLVARTTVVVGDYGPEVSLRADDLQLPDGAAVRSWTGNAGDVTAADDASTARLSATQGPSGAAVAFHGGRPLVIDEAQLPASTHTTVALVVRTRGQSTGLLERVGAWSLRATADGRLVVDVEGVEAARSDVVLVADQWHVVVVRTAPDAVTAWVDGTIAASTSATQPAAVVDADLLVGEAGGRRMQADLAEVVVRERQLDDTQVGQLQSELDARHGLNP